MKFIIIALLGLPAYAAKDSVALFLRPEKSVILINERGANSRLQHLIQAFGPEKELLWESEDKNFRFNCARDESKAECTISLLQSGGVLIAKKEVMAAANILRQTTDVSLEWASSRENRVTIEIFKGNLRIHGTKP